MVVAAAGNDGSSCSTIMDAPAQHTDLVFVVGAIDHRSGEIAYFSSRGPSAFDGKIGPDLSAPGVSVRSTVKEGGFASAGWSGTSMASPHVTGAVALLWSYDHKLLGDIDGTIKVFTDTAAPKTSTETCGGVAGSKVPNNTYGFGNIDVLKAAKTRTPTL
jgi:subtilisin family serine protease